MFDKGKTAFAVCLIAVLLALSVIGCGGGGTSNTPSGVAEAFLKGLVAHNVGDSYGYMSMKAKGETGMTLQSWNGIISMKDPIPKTATFSVKGENVQGDTATVTITPTGGTDRTVNLSKEDGKWKVDWELGEWYGLAPGY